MFTPIFSCGVVTEIDNLDKIRGPHCQVQKIEGYCGQADENSDPASAKCSKQFAFEKQMLHDGARGATFLSSSRAQ